MTPESFFGTGNVFVGQGSSVASQISSSSEVFIVIKWSGALNAVFSQESGGGYAASPDSVEDIITGIFLKAIGLQESVPSSARNFNAAANVTNPQNDANFRSGSILARWQYTLSIYGNSPVGNVVPKASEI